jgi:ABC-type ATPase with predicted acetyltransferase domain
MTTYRISKSFCWQGTITDKVALVCRIFGLTADRLTRRRLTYNCELEISDGDIVCFTGPSGAGKSVLLGELEQSIPASQRVNLARIELPCDKTLVDCLDVDVLSGLRLLSTAGLNDCFCILNQPDKLCAGQKYRFRLAVALAAQKKFIFADEFCSELDCITAAVISHNLHKFAKRTATTFILASSHQDILFDLEPDVLVTLALCGEPEVIYKRTKR